MPPAEPSNWSVPSGLDVIALRDHENRHLTIRVVNPQAVSIQASVSWQSFVADTAHPAAVQTLTSGSLNDSNTAGDQMKVAPRATRAAVAAGGKGLAAPLEFPNASLVVITVRGTVGEQGSALAPQQLAGTHGGASCCDTNPKLCKPLSPQPVYQHEVVAYYGPGDYGATKDSWKHFDFTKITAIGMFGPRE
jgi:hypothetical protein